MIITQEQEDKMTILHLEGRFDFSARKVFKETLDQAAERNLPVVLDLGQVTFLDSSALGLLVISQQALKGKHIPFYLTNPQTYVRQVLELANVAKMIPIYGTIKEIPVLV